MDKNNSHKNKIIFENSELPYDESGVALGFKAKRKIYSGKSKYQKIEILDTFGVGRLLLLDGVFQTSEKKEFIYHEMMAHLPIFYFQNKTGQCPKNILIIGGGDGGVLEEVLKHKVKKAYMVEIDEKVMEISQKYLPSISRGAFKNKRAEVIAGDGKEFIKKYKNFFDVIILDLSDPWGPAKDLISEKFYKNVKNALTANGVISVQSGSFNSQSKLVSLISKRLKKVFPSVKVHKAAVPVYGTGEFSFAIAANFNLDKPINFEKLKQIAKLLKPELLYWSPEIHSASLVLPLYLKKIL